MLYRYNEERKAREEIDSEVLSLNRKIKLLEDNIKRKEDRWAAADTSAANRLIGEVVQSRRRPLLGPSPG